MGNYRHSAGYYHHEDFQSATRGDTAASLGGYTGYRLEQDAEFAYINIYIPKNFAKLEELEVFLIAYATETPMYMRLVTDWCQDGEAYFVNNETNLHKSVNTVVNRAVELDILDCVDAQPVDPGDYIGIQVGRVAGLSPAHNTDALIVGARYKMLLKQKAES